MAPLSISAAFAGSILLIVTELVADPLLEVRLDLEDLQDALEKAIVGLGFEKYNEAEEEELAKDGQRRREEEEHGLGGLWGQGRGLKKVAGTVSVKNMQILILYPLVSFMKLPLVSTFFT